MFNGKKQQTEGTWFTQTGQPLFSFSLKFLISRKQITTEHKVTHWLANKENGIPSFGGLLSLILHYHSHRTIYHRIKKMNPTFYV